MNRKFRKASKNDLPDIVLIYNEAIKAGYQTADQVELTTEDRQNWFEEHQKSHFAIFVLEIDEQIVGWMSLSPYRNGRTALAGNAEICYYLTSSHQSKGLGSSMMEFGIQVAKERGIQNLVAILLDSNKVSIALLKKYGFVEWGRLPKMADINNQLIDHLYLGLSLNN